MLELADARRYAVAQVCRAFGDRVVIPAGADHSTASIVEFELLRH